MVPRMGKHIDRFRMRGSASLAKRRAWLAAEYPLWFAVCGAGVGACLPARSGGPVSALVDCTNM